MSYMFGICREKLSKKEVTRRDRICKEEGGYGFELIRDPGEGWKGWFSGPNRGDPFDSALRQRVLDRVHTE